LINIIILINRQILSDIKPFSSWVLCLCSEVDATSAWNAKLSGSRKDDLLSCNNRIENSAFGDRIGIVAWVGVVWVGVVWVGVIAQDITTRTSSGDVTRKLAFGMVSNELMLPEH